MPSSTWRILAARDRLYGSRVHASQGLGCRLGGFSVNRTVPVALIRPARPMCSYRRFPGDRAHVGWAYNLIVFTGYQPYALHEHCVRPSGQNKGRKSQGSRVEIVVNDSSMQCCWPRNLSKDTMFCWRLQNHHCGWSCIASLEVGGVNRTVPVALKAGASHVFLSALSWR